MCVAMITFKTFYEVFLVGDFANSGPGRGIPPAHRRVAGGSPENGRARVAAHLHRPRNKKEHSFYKVVKTFSMFARSWSYLGSSWLNMASKAPSRRPRDRPRRRQEPPRRRQDPPKPAQTPPKIKKNKFIPLVTISYNRAMIPSRM